MSATQQVSLPIIQWPVGDGFEVKSIKIGNRLRQFQLLSNGTALVPPVEAELAISGPGRCVQEWNRHDQEYYANVKMFATENKSHVYFVVTDVANRRLRAYSEELSEAQWKARLHEEEPNIDRSLWRRVFMPSSLPMAIDWYKTATDVAEVWRKSHEQSEVNLSRRDYFDGDFCTDTVLYVAHAHLSSANDSEWKRMQMIRRVRDTGTEEFVGEILEVGTQKSYLPIMKAEEYTDPAIHEARKKALVIGQYVPRPGGLYRLGFRIPHPEEMFLDFMPRQDLAVVSHGEVAAYVTNEILTYRREDGATVTTQYSTAVQVTKEMRKFRGGPHLPTIHIRMAPGLFRKFINNIEAVLPRITDARKQEEERLYGSLIQEGAIAKLMLHPSSTDESARMEALAELDRAYASTASADVFISENRTHGEVVVDQSLLWGYTFRTGDRTRGEAAARLARELENLPEELENDQT